MRRFSLILYLIVLFFVSFHWTHSQTIPTALTRASVPVIWEAIDSYTPPLYEGKALYPHSGAIKYVALPDASLGNPLTLTYTWRADGTVLGDQSGLGNNTLTLAGSLLGDIPDIIVQVKNSAGVVVGTGSAVVEPQNPEVVFYKYTPLEGVRFQTIAEHDLLNTFDSLILEVYPYFFSTPSRWDTTILYSWYVNDRIANILGEPSVQIDVATSTRSAKITSQATHLEKLLQQNQSSLLIQTN